MALAEYFKRNAVAASYVIAGFDEQQFAKKLAECRIGVSFSQQALSGEGRNLLELLIRILARLYPVISLRSGGRSGLASDLRDLALSINPLIEVDEGDASIGVCVGEGAIAHWQTSIFAGSDKWRGFVSTESPRTVGDSSNPFGAGIAATLAAANVFRALFLPGEDTLDLNSELSAVACIRGDSREPMTSPTDVGSVALAGLGAVGNAAVWALNKCRFGGELHLVDHESLEISNLQRYVLALRQDVGKPKVEIARKFDSNGLRYVAHQRSWQEFVSTNGYRLSRVLVAVDSARDRRAVQGCLPRWIANAWTQVEDIGISVHRLFSGSGACLSCLYLPPGKIDSEDVIIAKALKVPEKLLQVRESLFKNAPPPPDLLALIGERMGVPLERVAEYGTLPLRSLFVDGLCGGGLVPLSGSSTQRDLLVPLAHQSVLAGLLLAAALVLEAPEPYEESTVTTVTRIDLRRPLGEHLPQAVQKDPRHICICEDADYIAAFERKW